MQAEPQRTEPQRQEEIVYRADPFTFIFRELDLVREDIRDLKEDVKRLNVRIEEVNQGLNARIDHVIFDMNKRFDDINKRIDRLLLLVIINLLGIVAFLIKSFFF